MTTKNSDDIIQRYKSLSRIEISPDEQREIWENVEWAVTKEASVRRRKSRFTWGSVSAGAAAALLVLGGGWYMYSNAGAASLAKGQAPPVKPKLVYSNRQAIPTNVISMNMQDTNNGWVADADGTLLHTPDGGQHWSVQYSDPSVTFRSDALDAVDKGWVMGQHSLLHSPDGGLTWKPAPQAAPVNPLRIQFLNTNTGFVVAESQTHHNTTSIYRTADAGDSWAELYVPGVEEMSFNAPDHGFVLTEDAKAGYSLKYLHDIHSNATSSSFGYDSVPLPAQMPPTSSVIRRVYLVAQGDHSLWLAVTWVDAMKKPHAMVYHTDDLGKTWFAVPYNPPSEANADPVANTTSPVTGVSQFGDGAMVDCFHGFGEADAYAVMEDGSPSGTKELVIYKKGGHFTVIHSLNMKGYNIVRDFSLTDDTNGVAIALTDAEGTGTTKIYHFTLH